VQQTGIVSVEEYGYTYYLLQDGTKLTGLCEYDGKTYYFTDAGLMYTGLRSFKTGTDEAKIRYFMPETGVMVVDFEIYIQGILYTFDSEGYGTVVVEEDQPLSSVVAKGYEYLGAPYSFNEEEGVHCSRLITYALSVIGMDLYPLSETQMYSFRMGQQYELIDDAEAFTAGDLVYYINLNCGEENCMHQNEIHHVGIYLGDGDILEANVDEGVLVRKMNEISTYFIYCAVRVLE
jgi:hypothetical protein